jgi:hypothetical protein
MLVVKPFTIQDLTPNQAQTKWCDHSRTAVGLKDTLIELEKRLKRVVGEPEPREPMEIRQAVLEAVADMCRPAGRGRRVMPFDLVEVDVLAPSAETRRVFEAVFDRDGGLDAAARASLGTAGAEVAATFAVAITYRRKAPAGWQAGQRFEVRGIASGDRRPDTRPGTVADPPAALPVVTLKVLKGRTTRRSMEFTAARINIGRVEDVTDRDRRLVRRNDVVFTEGDAMSESVSRAHAHVRCGTDGECRLRDDGSSYGTRVVRGGRTIEVSAGNTRGVRLQSGDEVHVGQAVLRVEVRQSGARR